MKLKNMAYLLCKLRPIERLQIKDDLGLVASVSIISTLLSRQRRSLKCCSMLHKLNQRLNQNWVSCERPYVSEWALKTQQKWTERDEDGTETKSTKKRERMRGRSFLSKTRYTKRKQRKNNDRGTIIKQKKENPRMVS